MKKILVVLPRKMLNGMQDFNRPRREEVYSKRIKAGKRTYFLDVKQTRANDFFITITESKRRLNGSGYEKHKIYLYKEDFNKFLEGLTETINHVKSELMPDYDFTQFDNMADEDEDGYVTADADYEVVREDETDLSNRF